MESKLKLQKLKPKLKQEIQQQKLKLIFVNWGGRYETNAVLYQVLRRWNEKKENTFHLSKNDRLNWF